MKILCWNTDEAVWKHWNKVITTNNSLERVEKFEDLHQSLQEESFKYCFFYLSGGSFLRQVEDVASLCLDFPNQKIIVFPDQSNQQAALRLFSVGVSGQCAPYIGLEQLSLVLSVVDSGEIWGGKAFIQQLILQSATTTVSVQSNDLEVLSERELSVAQFIAKGLSNKQIAFEINITERTVKAHLTSIYKKTNTKDRLALGLLVQRNDQTF